VRVKVLVDANDVWVGVRVRVLVEAKRVVVGKRVRDPVGVVVVVGAPEIGAALGVRVGVFGLIGVRVGEARRVREGVAERPVAAWVGRRGVGGANVAEALVTAPVMGGGVSLATPAAI